MHGAHNYPFHKEKSDLDIGLKDGTDDSVYLPLLKNTLDSLIETVKPDFAFFLSGVDILETDKFGKLKITMNGCKQRDEIVFSKLQQLQIPCTVAQGGGYSPDIRTIVEAHCNTFRSAKDIYGLS
jgi:acetoin utilization deacetylase AcuC-like enzyme